MSIPREVLIKRKKYNEWLEHYKPMKGPHGSFEDIENYDLTDENRKKLSSFETNKIWSVSEGDDGGSILVSRFWDHHEVLSWVVTELPWSGEPGSI